MVTIQIHSAHESSSLELKCLGLEIKKEVEALGAKCLPVWDGTLLTVAVDGATPSAIEPLLTAFTESARKRSCTLSIVQRDSVDSPKDGLAANLARPGAIIRERLTRKFLFGLPAGAFVVSNLYLSGRSAFAEQIGEVRTRADAWKRAVASGAAQRLCQVCWSQGDFDSSSIAPFGS